MSALRTGRLYLPGNIHGTHFCYRLSQPQGHSAAGRILSMKNSNDTIGNRTRDLPACRAVPQPTAPPRAPRNSYTQVLMSGRSQWPRGLRRGPTATRLLVLRVRIPPGVRPFVACECCQRSLRLADHSSRGVLPSVYPMSVIAKPP